MPEADIISTPISSITRVDDDTHADRAGKKTESEPDDSRRSPASKNGSCSVRGKDRIDNGLTKVVRADAMPNMIVMVPLTQAIFIM